MNILYLESSIPPSRGGVQRVSWVLSRYFNEHGHDMFFAFWVKDSEEVDEYHKLRIGHDGKLENFVDKLLSFVRDRDIQLIINQGCIGKSMVRFINEMHKSNIHCKVVFCLHISPDYTDYCPITFRHPRQKLKNIISKLLYGMDIRIKGQKEQYLLSDKFVLLSETFREEFLKRIRVQNIEKLVSIPNPLSFSSFAGSMLKKKQVLIISRFEEVQKNLTAALRIWKEIEKRGYADWTLVLGGYGDDEKMILEYAKSLKMERLDFIGKVEEPQRLYMESSIFMMTSFYEGFGMVLTEALQCGCVPVAFDNFTALHDILVDGYNGYIIPSNDEAFYADRIESLMNQKKMLEKMAQNGIESSSKFSVEAVGAKWIRLINQLVK